MRATAAAAVFAVAAVVVVAFGVSSASLFGAG